MGKRADRADRVFEAIAAAPAGELRVAVAAALGWSTRRSTDFLAAMEYGLFAGKGLDNASSDAVDSEGR